jgi:hypothetical protein
MTLSPQLVLPCSNMNCVRISWTSCSRLSLAESVLLATMKRILMGGVGTNGPGRSSQEGSFQRCASSELLDASDFGVESLLEVSQIHCILQHLGHAFLRVSPYCRISSSSPYATIPAPGWSPETRVMDLPAPIATADPTSMLVPTVLEFQPSFVEKFVCRHTLHVQSFCFGYTLSVFLPLGSMKVLKNGLSF